MIFGVLMVFLVSRNFVSGLISQVIFFLYSQLTSAIRAYGVPWGQGIGKHTVIERILKSPFRVFVSAIHLWLNTIHQTVLNFTRSWERDLISGEEGLVKYDSFSKA